MHNFFAKKQIYLKELLALFLEMLQIALLSRITISISFFFFQAMNMVDFLAILPYFISLFIQSLEDLHILGKAGKIMRLVRVMRILRIFKLVRHFAGLQSLLYTLKQVCILYLLKFNFERSKLCYYFVKQTTSINCDI